jgi:hypothetical protein
MDITDAFGSLAAVSGRGILVDELDGPASDYFDRQRLDFRGLRRCCGTAAGPDRSQGSAVDQSDRIVSSAPAATPGMRIMTSTAAVNPEVRPEAADHAGPLEVASDGRIEHSRERSKEIQARQDFPWPRRSSIDLRLSPRLPVAPTPRSPSEATGLFEPASVGT